LLPSHLKIVGTVTKKSFSVHAALLPLPSCQVAGNIPTKILYSHSLSNLSLWCDRETLLNLELFSLWNSAWSSATTGAQTFLFFPPVESAMIFSSSVFPFFLCSMLSDNCGLNNFLNKIKRSSSPFCSSQLVEVEDAAYILFVCINHAAHKAILIDCAVDLQLSWPVSLTLFRNQKLYSLLLLNYCVQSKDEFNLLSLYFQCFSFLGGVWFTP
jgi:hypothetical protein